MPIPILDFKKSTSHNNVNQLFFLKVLTLLKKKRMGEFWLNDACQDCDRVSRKLHTTRATSRDVLQRWGYSFPQFFTVQITLRCSYLVLVLYVKKRPDHYILLLLCIFILLIFKSLILKLQLKILIHLLKKL